MQRLITASLLLISTALAISLTDKTCRYLDASQSAAESSDPFDPFR